MSRPSAAVWSVMNNTAWRHLAAVLPTAVQDDLVDSSGTLTPRGLCAVSVVVSAVLCLITFEAACLYSPKISAAYSGLRYAERREWDTRYFSCVHAILVSYLSYLALVEEDTFYKASSVPVLQRTSYTSYLNLGMSLGYFLVDLVICLKYKVGGTAMAYHHVAAFSSVLWASWSGFGHMPTVWLLGTEFTTPFINLRWWLDKAGMKASQVYLYNGLTIVVSWFFARILIFVPFYYQVWNVRHELKDCDWPTCVLLLGVPVLLTGLNCFWFTQIIKGAAKVLLASKDRAEAAAEAAAGKSPDRSNLQKQD